MSESSSGAHRCVTTRSLQGSDLIISAAVLLCWLLWALWAAVTWIFRLEPAVTAVSFLSKYYVDFGVFLGRSDKNELFFPRRIWVSSRVSHFLSIRSWKYSLWVFELWVIEKRVNCGWHFDHSKLEIGSVHPTPGHQRHETTYGGTLNLCTVFWEAIG